ncbi:SIR2 family protein [Shewanella sp. WPAGA9]|uniref:SIR2 family protein n=1 Tax=Shewanella sp. ENK2 TaxID=2775245 RepID=UPI00177A9765|nr:SIR2 family protein [Shewanella sp. WPAGA9]
MNYQDLEKELLHKKRTVKDLISYIETRSSGTTPNYSLLLGAGASYSSGIKTGVELVNDWRKEVYFRLSGDVDYEIDKAQQYFLKNEGSWYSLGNEYSSLFEKKFDLPAQRRRFVEEQVDKKLPSIGYSYLVSLTSTDNKYFDTIYTTNFDDLINEAFYQFSQTRPVICAHDSSVNSISISSSRPKVIKLHGDYLFDDIKSTLRETESLESNIKNKLIEFSKEYGLIVIGYAGNDRSIMDVINYLLKTDDYLKNGVYWCLRKGDYINPELRRLLWKDRVFYVEIDGFDQVMAEIHHNLIGELSLKDNFTNSKRDSIVSSFTDDEYSLCSTSNLICKDIEKLKKHKTDMDISNLIRELSGNNERNENSDDNTLSETDFKNLLSLDNLIKCKNLTSAKLQAESYIANCDNEEIKTKYIKKLIYIYDELGQNDQVHKLCEQLIDIDEFNADFAMDKAMSYKNNTDRCKYINSLTTKFDNVYYFHNFLVNNAIKEYNTSRGKPFFTCEKLIQSLEKSIALEPSLDNPAWILKLDVYNIKFENEQGQKSQKEKDDIANKLIESIKNINETSLVYYEARTHSFIFDEKYESGISIINELTDLLAVSKNKKQRSIVDTICTLHFNLSSHESSTTKLNDLKEFINSEIATSNKFSNQVSVLAIKAKYAINIERDIPKFLSIIDKLTKTEHSENWANFIVTSLCDVGKDYKKAEDYLNKIKSNIQKSFFSELMVSIKTDNSKYDEALKLIEESLEDGLSIDDYHVRKSYLLLKMGRYEQVIPLINNNLTSIRNKAVQDALIINREFANIKLNNKCDDLAVRNVISRGLSTSLTLCAECLLEKEVNARRSLKTVYKEDYLKLFNYAAWPVIPESYINSFFNSEATPIETDVA